MPLTGLERWMEAQERFDALRSTALAAGGARFCDLAYANAWGGPNDEVRAILRSAAESSGELDLQYTPYGGAVTSRRHAAQALARRTGLPFKHDHVVLTPGAMSALSLSVRAVSEGGNVVIPTPTWLDHPLYVAMHRHEPRLVPLRDDFALDLEALAAAIDEETHAVILTCPGNPTGHLFGEDELRALAEVLCSAPRAANAPPPLLVSDECHRDYVPADRSFLSPARFYDRTAVIYSYGKRFLVQGQRLGYVAVSPRHPEAAALVAALRRLARAGGFGTPTALMQLALPDLEALAPAVDGVLARKERTRAALVAAGLETRGDATMFLYVRCVDDWAATTALAKRGVLVLPAAIFHHHGWLRITASARDDMLERGIEHLIAVLREEVT
ncbi:MAG: pyridoxal phosphate-dependent aminotransferase [Sandaracinus sp.]|nr:pyridoxal phosphate-dependent aminotransferase [Sandaracinus sp.]